MLKFGYNDWTIDIISQLYPYNWTPILWNFKHLRESCKEMKIAFWRKAYTLDTPIDFAKYV